MLCRGASFPSYSSELAEIRREKTHGSHEGETHEAQTTQSTR